jgi:hypothetical protein
MGIKTGQQIAGEEKGNAGKKLAEIAGYICVPSGDQRQDQSAYRWGPENCTQNPHFLVVKHSRF